MFSSLEYCFGFCAFCFEAISHPNCYLNSFVDETQHGQLLLLSLCNFFSFLSYIEGVLVTNFYSLLFIYTFWLANYTTRGAFVIIVFICSDLLNCLRSVGTIVTTTESDWNSLKVIFTEQSLTKGTNFCCCLCIFCTTTSDISSSSENMNKKACVSRLSFCFLWLCFHWKIRMNKLLFSTKH